MQLGSPNASAESAIERRRVVRYPYIARVRVGTRCGVTCDMSSSGLAFHTPDRFAPNEVVELCLSFDLAEELPLHVVHPAKVVWIAQDERAWDVGVEFLD